MSPPFFVDAGELFQLALGLIHAHTESSFLLCFPGHLLYHWAACEPIGAGGDLPAEGAGRTVPLHVPMHRQCEFGLCSCRRQSWELGDCCGAWGLTPPLSWAP